MTDGDDVNDGDGVIDGDCVSDGLEVVVGEGDCDGVPTSSLLHVVVRTPGMSQPPVQQVLGNVAPSSASYHEH